MGEKYLNKSAPEVRILLESDRQWTRRNRLQHALWQMRNARTTEQRTLWRTIVKANAEDAEKW